MIKTQTKTNIIATTATPKSFTSSTLTAFTSVVPTSTTPVSDDNNIVTSAGVGISIKISAAYLSTATSPSFRVVGWNKNPTTGTWIPSSLGIFTPTIAGPVEVGNTYVSTWATAVAGASITVSGSSTVAATLVVHLQGSELVQLSAVSATAEQAYIVHVGTI